MQAEHLAHGLGVGREPVGVHVRGNPLGLDLSFACGEVVLSAMELGEDEPGEPNPEDEADEDEPPVELDVHDR